jgi:hypothetical protein
MDLQKIYVYFLAFRYIVFSYSVESKFDKLVCMYFPYWHCTHCICKSVSVVSAESGVLKKLSTAGLPKLSRLRYS